MSAYDLLKPELVQRPSKWLVTGAAAGERAWPPPVSGFYNVRKKGYKVWTLWIR
jgi:hypothetical protein